jgi:hypothetical protein
MRLKQMARESLLTITVVVAALLCSSVAFADALVVVQLSGDNPPDGRVTLTARQGDATFKWGPDRAGRSIYLIFRDDHLVNFDPHEFLGDEIF